MNAQWITLSFTSLAIQQDARQTAQLKSSNSLKPGEVGNRLFKIFNKISSLKETPLLHLRVNGIYMSLALAGLRQEGEAAMYLPRKMPNDTYIPGIPNSTSSHGRPVNERHMQMCSGTHQKIFMLRVQRPSWILGQTTNIYCYINVYLRRKTFEEEGTWSSFASIRFGLFGTHKSPIFRWK